MKNEILEFTKLYMEFIEFKEKIKPKYTLYQRGVDLSLCYLFENFKDNEDLQEHLKQKFSIFEFHKGFRIYPIVENFDAIFWQLISSSEMFYVVYEHYIEGKSFNEFTDEITGIKL